MAERRKTGIRRIALWLSGVAAVAFATVQVVQNGTKLTKALVDLGNTVVGVFRSQPKTQVDISPPPLIPYAELGKLLRGSWINSQASTTIEFSPGDEVVHSELGHGRVRQSLKKDSNILVQFENNDCYYGVYVTKKTELLIAYVAGDHDTCTQAGGWYDKQ